MATRDLTSAYIELRARKAAFAIAEAKTDVRLLDDAESRGAHTDTWRVSLPPHWVDTFDQMELELRELDRLMDELTTLHTQRLMVTFDDSEARRDREIQSKTRAITDCFRHMESSLQRVASGDSGDESDAKVRGNIQRATAKKLQERNQKFRSMQKEYMRKLRLQKNRTSGGGELDFLTEPPRPSDRARMLGLTQQQVNEVEHMEAMANERDEEIAQIAQSIEELSQIFKELAVLVIDQGTILDRIDFNMEQVVEHTQEGLGQLGEAEKHQKSARPVKCIVCLLVMIFIMLGLLILKHKR